MALSIIRTRNLGKVRETKRHLWLKEGGREHKEKEKKKNCVKKKINDLDKKETNVEDLTENRSEI